MTDTLVFYDTPFTSRLLLGTAQYPSPAILAEAVRASGAGIVTVSLRRESGGERSGQSFWGLIRELGVKVLPNTAGCHSVKEAVTTAQMAREVFGTSWIKLEVIGDADTLQPDVFGLVEVARILVSEGFEVFPYTTEDLVVAERLVDAGIIDDRCAGFRIGHESGGPGLQVGLGDLCRVAGSPGDRHQVGGLVGRDPERPGGNHARQLHLDAGRSGLRGGRFGKNGGSKQRGFDHGAAVGHEGFPGRKVA